VLVDASHNAALFARGERLALEAVDAVVEALLDEVGVHLDWSVLLSCSIESGWRTFMNSFICFFSMRDCSSRCSDAVSLHAISYCDTNWGKYIRLHDAWSCVVAGLLFTEGWLDAEIWYDVGWLSGCCADEPAPKSVDAS